jgi:hypothetical protein
VREGVLNIALGALESVELRSLAWGFVDQSLEESEAEDAIALALQAASLLESAPDVLDALVDAALVRKLYDGSARRYRTRIAELTRLLTRLRQWFDRQPWQAAATLVSDFRIDIRPRRYPRRHIAPEDAWEIIDPERRHSALHRNIWVALTAAGPAKVMADFQIESVRRLLLAERGSATIVTAGTGSGKTLAFYLPALLRIAPEVRVGEWWTKVVCLYPRQELLKDQLSDAYGLVLRAGEVLKEAGRRPIVLGSLFGPTPFDASVTAVAQAGWESRPEGYVCPFLRCPTCGSDMVWPNEALRDKREMLRCAASTCETTTEIGSVRLTRRSVQAEPPDLLFTTTEMMNQRLSDTWTRHVFGVGQHGDRIPVLTLLDEAHTYAGISGAQTALLLRRWLALLGTKMRWAGLSATLPHAAQFFAELTGTWADNVAVIAPAPVDMVEEGAEYQIILRSDPSSQTSTLSTSIQALMLLARMLDRRDQMQSGGRFGSKVFVFTDDLDVTHRLFDDLLDAEAYNSWRRPNPVRRPLAALRDSTQPDPIGREREGQRWQMAEDLRGTLSDRLVISRTTSRDPGVNSIANVVVATSALEVGFNDPDVGAVVQHKAPRSAASFLQRRGRAGRSRVMRPLTILVLSDYGRDRAAFQSYEQLFEPFVEIAPLPIRNLYVLRMQAVFATLEWIAMEAPSQVTGWAWRVLTGPAQNDNDRRFREHAKSVLQRILQFDASTLERLRSHLQSALTVDVGTLNSILWQPPRALLLEALPTLARRLFRDWQLAFGDGLDLHVPNPPHPLPDFVPANLFSDLNLPEVQVVLPGARDPEYMPVVSALQQFAPGRVSRRFADAQGNISHWFPLNPAAATQDVRVRAYASRHEFVGTFVGMLDGSEAPVPVYRPWELQLAVVPQAIADSSNAQWQWQSGFERLGLATFIELPNVASTIGVIDRLELRLHRFGSGVSIRRFAHEGRASLRVNRQETLVQFRLVDDDNQPAAIGYSLEADALLVEIRLPNAGSLATLPLHPELARWLRYLALKQRTAVTSDLPASFNSFRRDWLHQVVLLASLTLAERDDLPLETAIRQLRANDDPTAFTPAIEALVAGTVTGDADDISGNTAIAGNPTALHVTLAAGLAEPGVLSTLLDLTLRWIAPLPADWGSWLAEVASSTVAEAVYQACVLGAPQNAAADGLTVDIEATGGNHRAIVAETILGGGGTLESIGESFAADPRAFVRALESACAPSDQEVAADGLRFVVAQVVEQLTLGAALSELRSANNAETRDAARRELFRLLAESGIPVSRTLSIQIATRLVRPAASPDSDRLTLELLRAWQRLEEKHGVALPSRLAAAAVVLTTPLRQSLADLGGGAREILTANLLLWPAGGELRQRALQSYNAYRTQPFVDAALARLLLFDARLALVEFGTPDWHRLMTEALALHGIVRLTTRHGDARWRAALFAVLSAPITSGFLQFYPMIEAMRTLDDGRFAIDLLLRERV